MEVPWSLKGATLHNITVALCISPALHHFLTLVERCEAAVCGFVLLDLWKLCADKKAVEMGVPKGTTWMASQTQYNLQGTALSTIALCVAKSDDFMPWRYGFARLSELPIEQQFGHLRSQVASAQLSTRGFWHADARQSLKINDVLNKCKAPPPAQERALTDSESLAMIGCIVQHVHPFSRCLWISKRSKMIQNDPK